MSSTLLAPSGLCARSQKEPPMLVIPYLLSLTMMVLCGLALLTFIKALEGIANSGR
jgi:hypothetical protein